MRVMDVWNENRSVSIGDRIEVAENSARRVIGLLGRAGLLRGEGLWIKPCSGVHTFGMRFPIDIVGLNQNLHVVKLAENVRPNKIAAVSWIVRSVLELPAGTIAQTHTQLGDVLAIRGLQA